MADDANIEQSEPLNGRRRRRPLKAAKEGRVRRRVRKSDPSATLNPDGSRVGYGNPPKHGRFKPGQSGNPKGRPKRRKNFLTELQEELSELVSITENGKTLKVSKQRVLVKSLFNRASKGEPKALAAIFNLIEKAGPVDGVGQDDNGKLSTEDQAIMDELLAKLGSLPIDTRVSSEDGGHNG